MNGNVFALAVHDDDLYALLNQGSNFMLEASLPLRVVFQLMVLQSGMVATGQL